MAEQDSKETIPYATIQTFVSKTTSNPLYSCVSDNNGKFIIELKTTGEFDIVFSYIGKSTFIRHIVLDSITSIDLGMINLEDKAIELSEVNVYGQRILMEVLPDKFIYNVKDDAQAFNSTLYKIAEKIPLLIVNQENGILLNSCTPLILLNGKKLKSINNHPAFYLKNNTASNIDKIEIITNPGSRYDADIDCGIVNIITKRSRETSLTLGSETDSNLGYDVFANYGFKYKKLTVNGNIAYNSTHKFDTKTHTERINKQETYNYKLTQNEETELLYNDISKELSADLSYEFDTLNTLSFSAGYFHDNVIDTTFQENIMNTYSNYPAYIYNLMEYSNLKFGYYNLGASYEFVSKNKQDNIVVSVLKDVNFSTIFNRQQTLPVLDWTASSVNYNQDEKQDENTVQIDYIHNFKNSSQLSIGAKSIFRNNSSIGYKLFSDSIANVEENEIFKNIQQVHALYSEYALKIFKRYSINTGLRLESTKINGNYKNNIVNDFTTHYANILPYLLISTKMKNGISLNGSYSTKINRPNVYALNPAIFIIDNQTVYYGNPSLTSEYLNTFSFSYSNWSTHIKQYAKLSYRFSNNFIQNISGITDNIFYTTYTNDGKYNELTLNLNFSSQLTTWLQYRLGGSGSHIFVNIDEMVNSGFTGIIYSRANFTLPNDYYIGINGMYRFPTITLQGSGWNFYTYAMNASKSFLGDKLNIELTLSNPFRKTKKYSKTIETDKMQIDTEILNMGCKIEISVNYNFNKKDLSANKACKNIENNDLKGSKDIQ
ncbi:MAG: outer membrane beta-barrel protein [Saprospiraceae bacterium]